jgi:hypothetical protein
MALSFGLGGNRDVKAGVGFIDRATLRVYRDAEYSLHRFQVGRCDVCIFDLRSEPRVFVWFSTVALRALLDEGLRIKPHLDMEQGEV